MSEIDEKCKGCSIARSRAYSLCAFIEEGLIKVCPCTECLVKVMCREECIERTRMFYIVKSRVGDI